MKKNWLIGLLVVVLVVVAAVGWWQALQYKSRAEIAEGSIKFRQDMVTAASDLAPATFVRRDGDTVFYRVPRQVTLDGKIFVDSVELSAVITPDTELIGISGANNELALRTIKEGAELRIRTALDSEGASWLEVLQVLP